jgi:hypothetical protein
LAARQPAGIIRYRTGHSILVRPDWQGCVFDWCVFRHLSVATSGVEAFVDLALQVRSRN